MHQKFLIVFNVVFPSVNAHAQTRERTVRHFSEIKVDETGLPNEPQLRELEKHLEFCGEWASYQAQYRVLSFQAVAPTPPKD